MRILRVARFVARFGFGVAEETMALMRRMVETGEGDHLVAERVWREFARGLQEPHPARMLETLDACGLSARLLPELADERAALERAAAAGAPLAVRFAALTWGLPEAAVRAVCERLKPPNEERDLALAASRTRGFLASRTAPDLLEALKRADALRRPERFAELLQAARLADPGLDLSRIEAACAAAAAVDAAAIARQYPAEVGPRVEQAREAAIARVLAKG